LKQVAGLTEFAVVLRTALWTDALAKHYIRTDVLEIAGLGSVCFYASASDSYQQRHYLFVSFIICYMCW